MRWIVSIFLFCLLAMPAQAAELFFGSAGEVIAPGQALFGVFVNTEGQRANAFEGMVQFDPAQAAYVGYRDGGSVITQWIERPAILCDTLCNIGFSGITVGGINASDAFLFSFVVETKADAVQIGATNVRVLLNDGEGTELPVVVRPLTVLVDEEGAASFVDEDTTAPMFGTVEVVQDPSLYEGRRVLVFSVTDKGSGVANVEVREGSGDWVEARSPYLLVDQTGKSRIELRAEDASGNVATHIIEPAGKNLVYAAVVLFGIIMLVIILSRLLWRRGRK